MSNKTQSTVTPHSPATLKDGRWHDATGARIEGPAPLAQLGVGGQYVDREGHQKKIIDVRTDDRGFVYVTAVPA